MKRKFRFKKGHLIDWDNNMFLFLENYLTDDDWLSKKDWEIDISIKEKLKCHQ